MDALDRTLLDVMKDVPISRAKAAADALGLRLQELETTIVRDLDAYQLIDLCKASGIRADTVLGL